MLQSRILSYRGPLLCWICVQHRSYHEFIDYKDVNSEKNLS